MSEPRRWTLDGLDAVMIVQRFEQIIEALSLLPDRAFEEQRTGRIAACRSTWAEIEEVATAGANVPEPFRAGEALQRFRKLPLQGISGVRPGGGPLKALDRWAGRQLIGKKASDDEHFYVWVRLARIAQLDLLQQSRRAGEWVDEARALILLQQLIANPNAAPSPDGVIDELPLLEAVHAKVSILTKARLGTDRAVAATLRLMGGTESIQLDLALAGEVATSFGWNNILWELHQPGRGLAYYHGYSPDAPPGWHPDPTQRWPWRYWDGYHWTSSVSGGDGTVHQDPA